MESLLQFLNVTRELVKQVLEEEIIWIIFAHVVDKS